MEGEKITEGNYYFSLEIVARKNVQNEINTTPRARVIVMKCSAVGGISNPLHQKWNEIEILLTFVTITINFAFAPVQ